VELVRIGVDIGGTKTDAVVIGDETVLMQRARSVTGFGSQAVVETAVSAISHVASLAGTPVAGFDSIGIGIPGMVDGHTGGVRHAVNLGFDALELGAELQSRLGVRVQVENDVKAAALGAYHLLGLASSMAYLNLGTGLAAGIVVDGELWRGARATAGEIGHIPVDPNGLSCPCGQRGCLETVASGSGIARQWPTEDPHPVRDVFRAARAGDAAAMRIRGSLADGVASAVRILVLTADVETVVIGGGLSHLGEELMVEVRAVLTTWAESSLFLASLDLPSRMRVTPENTPAAAIGAALIGAV
jgi:predicted NBD/HSP70 family sugar kinase